MLSRILFKFYLFDLLSNNATDIQQIALNVLKFADDMTVVLSEGDTRSCVSKFESVSRRIIDWCSFKANPKSELYSRSWCLCG